MKSIVVLLVLMTILGVGGGSAQKRSKRVKPAPAPVAPTWEWLEAAQDEEGRPYYIDKSKIFRLMENATYSIKWERNGVDLVFVAVSNCLRGTMTGIPAFVIDKDGEVTKLSQSRESIASTNGEPLEAGSPLHSLMLYACKNAKQLK